MRLYIQKTQEHKTMKFSGTVLELLKRIGINPETVIVTRHGLLVPDDARLTDTDDVEVLQVTSGG